MRRGNWSIISGNNVVLERNKTMIIKTEEFQEACKKILGAVDTDSAIKNVIYGYDTLEVDAHEGKIHLNVTNGEYYVSVVLDASEDESFRAVVDAKVFLTLVSKITTAEMELRINGTSLEVQANGVYKFPMKYLESEMVVLPKLDFEESTVDMTIQRDKLVSMLNFNGPEFNNGTISRPVQKLYFLDQEGCITWTNSSACVNSFSLPVPVTVLLNQKVVKLFKLLKGEDIKFSLGHVDVNGMVQTRVRFEDEGVVIYSIVTSDEAIVNSVPKAAVRGKATKPFPYSAPIRAKELSDAIDRLLLFSTSNIIAKGVCVFEFLNDRLNIYDARKENVETLQYYDKELEDDVRFTINLNVVGIKNILDNSDEQFVTINFGDDQVVVVANGAIKNVVSNRVIS